MAGAWGPSATDGSGWGGASGPRAGFWIRLLSLLIDALALSIVGYLLRYLLANTGEVIYVALAVSYYVVLIGSPRGQTLGCVVTGIRVISFDSRGSIGMGRSAIRYVVSLVSGFAFLIGYLWAIWDPEKQTWHDKAAGSVVVPVSYYPIETGPRTQG